MRQAFSSADFDGDGLVAVKDIPTIFNTLDEMHKELIIEGEDLQRCVEQIDVDSKIRLVDSQRCKKNRLLSKKLVKSHSPNF